MNTKDNGNDKQQKQKAGSGNYEDDIPIDENVVNYRTNKTAGEEGKKVALKDEDNKTSEKSRKESRKTHPKNNGQLNDNNDEKNTRTTETACEAYGSTVG